MIQFKRGKTGSWQRASQKLAPGQPGYDKDKHKLKIGDGIHSWKELPYVSGLFKEEVLDSETNLDTRRSLDSEAFTLFTYGTEAPSKTTNGSVYLQYIDSEPEDDYIVSSGTNNGWQYQKWHKGFAKCWRTIKVTTAINDKIEGSNLYLNNSPIVAASYPFTFTSIPTETATVQSAGSVVWLASNTKRNTKKQTASYSLISPTSNSTKADYYISFTVCGSWK